MDIEIREFITYLHNTKKNIGKYRDLIPKRSEKNGGISEGTGNQKL